MTFTVLARDLHSGLIGAATASRSLAVGNAVLAVRPGVGAAASQAWTNRSLRARLLDALEYGSSAADAVERIDEWDDAAQWRQVALLPVAGPGAARTGQGVTDWAGHLVDHSVVVAGNLLAGPEVLQAMLASAQRRPSIDPTASASAAHFAAGLVAVLAAGQSLGGDVRGQQSAAVLVASTAPDGEVRVDLRIDDHDEPLNELQRLVTLRAHDLERARSD